MEALVRLIADIQDLIVKADHVMEDSYRLVLTGEFFSADVISSLLHIDRDVNLLSLPNPTLRLMNSNAGLDENIDIADADSYINDGIQKKWTFTVSKTTLAKSFPALRDSEEKVLFFSESNLVKWIDSRNPFTPASAFEPTFSDKTTFWVYGLSMPFGGDSLWVVPVGWDGELAPANFPLQNLPSSQDVHGLLHLSVSHYFKINPNAFVITWGSLESSAASSFMRLSVLTLSCCLGHEIKGVDNEYYIVFKGTKRISKLLEFSANEELFELQTSLLKAVSWAYEERPETRLQLIMDRLSLDITESDNIFSGLKSYLDSSLQQSQDSYAFVILDRKDSYHKEMRELLKDMRSQADLYAAKVRDLVSNITRDILGVLAFVGFSFISKFDPTRLRGLLDSPELAILVKFLAGYLMLSCVLQIIAHLRDARLSRLENQNWLRVLQRYTSSQDNTDNFLSPIARRRRTLFISIFIMAILYVLLFLATWNLPAFIKFILSS
ncbi:hypothetical protein [Pseudomonas graminis]